MTVEISQLPNEPIVVATIYEPIDMSVDPQTNRDRCNTIAQQTDGPLYRITDFSNFSLTFSQLVVGLVEDIKFSEANIVHLIVGSGEMMQMQLDAIRQEQYGAHDVQLFASVDDAIAYARDQIAG